MAGFSIYECLHGIMNMPEYVLTEFWIYLGFYICQDSEHGSVPNMQEFHRILNITQYGWEWLRIFLNMSEFTLIDKNIPEYVWIYDNRHGSEYVSYNIWWRWLYKLMSTYLQMSISGALSKVYDRALWRTNYD